MNKKQFSLDKFCFRQFEENYTGSRIENISKEDFINKINELFETNNYKLKDGYAPFCKHVFVPNFCGAKVSVLEITKENEHLLETGYQSRTPKELPVLVRWFPKEKIKIEEAKFLDVILYSREQIIKENEAIGEKNTDEEPWGVISVKSQNEDFETPMNPITMMRNALGKEEGGSGVPLDRLKYQESVDYWKNHAIIG
eukprot:gene8997-1096_t